MGFGEVLKNLRELNDVRQNELASYLKVSRSTIAGYETKGHEPDYGKLSMIANYFDVSIDYLLNGDNQAQFLLTKSSNKTEEALNQQFKRLYPKLSTSAKQSLIEYADFLLSKQNHL